MWMINEDFESSFISYTEQYKYNVFINTQDKLTTQILISKNWLH